MHVAIMDYDVYNTSLVKINVDVMKLSAYYKSQGHLVTYINSLQKLDMYDLVFIRKNSKRGEIPKYVYAKPNVRIGGEAFTQGVRFPLKPEIEAMEPDPFIYDSFFEAHPSRPNKSIQTYMKNTSFIFIEDENFKEKAVKDNVCVCDPYLCDEDFDKIDSLGYNKVNIKNSVYIDSLDQAEKWFAAPWIKGDTKIIYPHVLSKKQIKEFSNRINKVNKTGLNLITYTTETGVTIKSDKALEDFLLDTIDKILFCKINKERVFFINNPTLNSKHELIKEVQRWGSFHIRKSFYDNVAGSQKSQLDLFIKKNATFKTLFKTCPKEVADKGGQWI